MTFSRAAAIAGAVALSLMGRPASAMDDDISFDPARMLTEAELDRARGGFIVVDGYTLDFGAVIRSYANGELALESRFNLSGAGLTSESGQPGGALSSQTLSAFRAGGLDLGDLASNPNAYVTADGSGAFVHQLSNGQFANIMANTGSDRDLRQDTTLTLVLPGFESVQQGMTDVLAARQLMGDIGNAAMMTH